MLIMVKPSRSSPRNNAAHRSAVLLRFRRSSSSANEFSWEVKSMIAKSFNTRAMQILLWFESSSCTVAEAGGCSKNQRDGRQRALSWQCRGRPPKSPERRNRSNRCISTVITASVRNMPKPISEHFQSTRASIPIMLSPKGWACVNKMKPSCVHLRPFFVTMHQYITPLLFWKWLELVRTVQYVRILRHHHEQFWPKNSWFTKPANRSCHFNLELNLDNNQATHIYKLADPGTGSLSQF